ncbi:uncharacterized protein BT62DRAFT_529398 [Guyanagaster necrorhizus]|uniref:F-box domain-containing protein n=1 Tax=Guyanagaster necrorhizus TaxID=856835 RepID=A0A9P7W147_9AGAR|nr:uncharacterized protein BT62DRAFT_529398 [Guyanagaster necrorhizus MCA 3950]KAG7450677.1 hypothetical protein BT62DRAFT_529398 [Guyanagaster necrorhizus MCA 3950]
MPALPTELFLVIFSFLDARNLITCRQVCQLFLALIDETVALVYTIELDRHGHVDNSSVLPSTDRLDRLREHNAAWNKLDGAWSGDIPKFQGHVWELFGNVLAQHSGSGSLVFTQLPSSTRFIEQKEWSVSLSGLPIRDFGMDPSQDLLVLIETSRWGRNPNPSFQLHLWSMSSGKAHVYASVPVLKHAQKVPDHGMSYTIQVSGDYLGVEFNGNNAPKELVVWNWKTGRKELYLTGNEICSFAFLTENHILVAVSNNTELCLFIVDFIAESSEQTRINDVTYHLALRLPDLHPSTTLVSLTVRCDPSPTWPNQDDSILFHVHPDEILYPVALCTAQGNHIMIFIPRRILLAQLHHLYVGTKEVEWSAWGPQGTRILDCWNQANVSLVWACNTFGSRFVAFDVDQEEIDVYDFNQMTLKRELGSGCPSQYGNPNEILWPPVNQEDPTMFVIDDTVVPLDSLIFQQEVRTSLPFRARAIPTALGTGRFSAMCSQDNIIVVNANSVLLTGREYRVFTL